MESKRPRTVYIIDTETTGLLGHPVDVVVDIGISRVDLDKLTVKPVYSSVVGHDTSKWSEDRIHSWIFENTDLTVEEVSRALPQEYVAREVRGILYGNSVTSYNIQYDFLKFLNHYPWNLDDVSSIVSDPMLAATVLCKLPSVWGAYKWPKLQQAYDLLVEGDPAGIHGTQDHRALSDTLVAGHVMLSMFKDGCYSPDVISEAGV